MSSVKATYHTLLAHWHTLTGYKLFWPVFMAAGLAFCIAVDTFEFVDLYIQLILIYVGINIILTVSLNLINGYMGEFSVGHAGFMAVGAYIASLLTVHAFPAGAQNLLFPVAILAGGIGAALVGFLVAIPSFKTRGDYLAIVTLAFAEIIRLVLENWNAFSFGPSGISNIPRPGFFGMTLSPEQSAI